MATQGDTRDSLALMVKELVRWNVDPEVLFRMVRNAATGAEPGGVMLRSTLEHPALGSSMTHWAGVTGRDLIEVAHDDASGVVTVEAYKACLLYTSPSPRD